MRLYSPLKKASRAAVRTWTSQSPEARSRILTISALALFACVSPAFGADPGTVGSDPWSQAVENLRAAFTGSIARGLSLIAIVVGGLMFAFGEASSKRMFSGIIFGIGMAMAAVNFMDWLFPATGN